MWLSLLQQACEAPELSETAPQTDSAVVSDSGDAETEIHGDQPGTIEINSPQ